MPIVQSLIALAERGLLPDPFVRAGIRLFLRQRLREQEQLQGADDDPRGNFAKLIERLRRSPVAVHADKANEQHYELPPEFFERVLGPRLKYSCCYWPSSVRTLAAAEEAMLELTARRADLQDGQRVLDLGCGWGSFTLWAAERYPRSEFVAVSNSRNQRDFITHRCRQLGLRNVRAVVADVGDFAPDVTFDRVVTIEMFEHMRNHAELLRRIASWLEADGKLFVHVFVHRWFAYPYDTQGATNWMGRYFFTGGMMPSDDLLLRYQQHLVVDEHWRLNGQHYQKTAKAWRSRLESNKRDILPVLSRAYGAPLASLWFHRWRLFFLACEEMFGFRGGREWWVSHYAFAPRPLSVRQEQPATRRESLYRTSSL